MKNNKQKIIHLVYIPFTGVGIFGGFRGQEWFAKRIEIFKQYTLKSLLNQTNKNFVCWISFRSQERDNSLVKELEIYLDALQFPFIFTFDGLMYADDRYFPRMKDRLPWLWKTIRGMWKFKHFTFYSIWSILRDKNATLKKRVENSLKVIKPIFSHSDLVYMTRIDSDDMFHKDVVKELQETQTKHKAIVIREGYIYNRITRELSEWSPTTNPPFHTIVFPYDVFFDAEKYVDYLGGYRSHEDVIKLYDHTALKGRKYCVLTHGWNISTCYNHRFRAETVNNKNKILNLFGIK